MFLTRELIFPTNIASISTTSVVKILPSFYIVHSEKLEKFSGLNFKW